MGRVMAGFFDHKHSVDNKSISLADYIKIMGGCQVRMLTDSSCSPPRDLPPVQPSRVKEAIRNLDKGFAFVGITEEWELSVCLFHAMFGGQCRDREFTNTRPSRHPHKKKEENTSPMHSRVGLIRLTVPSMSMLCRSSRPTCRSI